LQKASDRFGILASKSTWVLIGKDAYLVIKTIRIQRIRPEEAKPTTTLKIFMINLNLLIWRPTMLEVQLANLWICIRNPKAEIPNRRQAIDKKSPIA
jgi:hypothetical protein